MKYCVDLLWPLTQICFEERVINGYIILIYLKSISAPRSSCFLSDWPFSTSTNIPKCPLKLRRYLHIGPFVSLTKYISSVQFDSYRIYDWTRSVSFPQYRQKNIYTVYCLHVGIVPICLHKSLIWKNQFSCITLTMCLRCGCMSDVHVVETFYLHQTSKWYKIYPRTPLSHRHQKKRLNKKSACRVTVDLEDGVMKAACGVIYPLKFSLWCLSSTRRMQNVSHFRHIAKFHEENVH